ncbi:MAG: pilus assembly PilX N-terminal domain-containing protein [Acidobacteriota bacterium]|nr:pilus assembly PilX N-terminal domain-containing protein [Acidobacteriota bacterium]MDQ7088516.1 pilus assembly PilX N-terminal domain-containing protein [Acidobacteriota bacterium]
MITHVNEKGSALVVVLFVISGLTLIGLAMLGSATLSLKSASVGADDAELFYIAEAGLERMIGDVTCSLVGQPDLDHIFDNYVMLHMTHGRSRGADGEAGTSDDSGRDYVNVQHGRGTFTIDILCYPSTIAEARNLEFVDMNIRSTATIGDQTKTVSSVIRLKLIPSRVFDNAYFMNNFGWMSGWSCGSLYMHGNLRANGDIKLYNSCVRGRGTPYYEKIVVNDLIGRIHDGGLIAGGRILGADDVQGDYADSANQHEYQDVIPMPNLSDLSIYVKAAREWNGGTPGDDGIWGTPDDTGGSTLQVWDRALGRYRTYRGCIGCNLGPDGLWGTADDFYGRDGLPNTDDDESPFMVLDGRTQPIIIDGPVVIGSPGADGIWNTDDEWDATGLRPMTGAVIIVGRVSGQGSIYTPGNIYLPDQLVYDNPTRPHLPGDGTPPGTGYGNSVSTNYASMAEEDIEGWRQLTTATSPAGTYQVRDADMLGLFARENIIIGRFTNGAYWGSVDGWLADPDNESKEDLGLDNLPNTGDTNEGNGTWDVRTYASNGANQCGSGLIPAGYSPGDVIPGSGEDLDGDGRYDATIVRGSLNAQGIPSSGSSSFAFPEDINDRLDSSASDPNTATPIDTDGDGLIWRGSPFWTDSATNHSWAEIAPYLPQTDSVHAVLYTNHAIAGVQIRGPSGFHEYFGAFVARVEATVGSAISVFSHDPRLLGGAKDFGLYLPREKAIEVRAWKEEIVE